MIRAVYTLALNSFHKIVKILLTLNPNPNPPTAWEFPGKILGMKMKRRVSVHYQPFCPSWVRQQTLLAVMPPLEYNFPFHSILHLVFVLAAPTTSCLCEGGFQSVQHHSGTAQPTVVRNKHQPTPQPRSTVRTTAQLHTINGCAERG